MKRPLATCIVCIGLSSTAQAAEWSMDSTLRETLEASDNPFLRGVPAAALGSYSTILGHVTGKTKTSRFDFDTDFNYKKYWGPGAVGSLAETNSNSVRAHYETIGKVPGDKNYVDAVWQRRSTALAILEDFGLPTNVSGDIHTSTIAGGIERALTQTDFWSLSSRATSTNYQPASGGTQYYDVATTSTYRHQSNSTSALTGQSEFEWLKYDNATETSIMIIRQMAGLTTQPFRNLNFVVSAGAATVVVEQGNLPAIINPFVPQPTSGVATGFIGNARLSYSLFPTTQLTLAASRSVGPTVTGVLTTTESASAFLSYTINAQSSLTTGVSIGRQSVASSQNNTITASTTYRRTLARDWNLDLTYRYTHRNAAAGSTNLIFDPVTGVPILPSGTAGSFASSNSVLFVLSKRFVILPKRT